MRKVWSSILAFVVFLAFAAPAFAMSSLDDAKRVASEMPFATAGPPVNARGSPETGILSFDTIGNFGNFGNFSTGSNVGIGAHAALHAIGGSADSESMHALDLGTALLAMDADMDVSTSAPSLLFIQERAPADVRMRTVNGINLTDYVIGASGPPAYNLIL
jgi:hypothetical protein